MKQRYLNFLLALTLCAPGLLPAQVSFTNANAQLPSTARSGVAIAVADMNGDGLDDIVRLSQGRVLQIVYQGSGGFNLMEVGMMSNQSQWSMCLADVDNNGFPDVISGGRYDNIKLARANADGSVLAISLLPGNNIFAQASNLADINNDGWIDLFVCHDDGESGIWGNDGAGNLMPADDWIDMATVPVSDNSGNYGSIWSDIDLDGDLDLYIAKCRQGVNNPADPRRINALFINDGQGNFTEQAAEHNLKIGAQSWTADFQDIDNDGDYDCFITNHDVPSMLLENDGNGIFTDITATSGIVVQGLPIQGVMRDFDNDGFVDILVSGTRQHLFRNNGDRTFTEVTGIFDLNQLESYAIGDLNHDGYLDIYGGYAQIYTTPSNIDDVLWLNNGGANNFLTVSLVGTQSNRSGVGARVEIYGGWGLQVREVRAGESYGIMNSLQQHFGLGAHQTVDSLVVRWPSGIVDKFTDLAANQFVNITENSCVSPDATVSISGATTICTGQTVTLTAPEGFNYSWSNGQTTQSIAVGESGDYNVTITDGTSCFGVSQSVSITVDPDETPSLSAQGDTIFCRGGSVTLLASPGATYSWSTGETTPSIEVSASGLYTVAVPGLCATFTSAPIAVTVLDAPAPQLVSQDLTDQLFTLEVTGTDVQWFLNETDLDPFATGNSVSTPVVNDTSFVWYADSRTDYPGQSYSTGQPAHQGGAYSGNQFNGGLIFDCESPFVLQKVLVYTDTPGPRTIELQDAAGNVLQSVRVDVQPGEQVLDLNMWIEPGIDLLLTTNADSNLVNFGYESPRLRRSDAGIVFPYEVPGVLRIKDTNLGSNRYYYFYDWRIQEPSQSCLSERVAFPFTIVDTDEATAPTSQPRVFPNPTRDLVHLSWPDGSAQPTTYRLLDLAGRTLAQGQLTGEQPSLTLAPYPAGWYWLELTRGGQRHTLKLTRVQ